MIEQEGKRKWWGKSIAIADKIEVGKPLVS